MPRLAGIPSGGSAVFGYDAAIMIVFESTGGYQRAVVAALAAAGLPVVGANPRQVRDFARAVGILAKTDAIDAAAIIGDINEDGFLNNFDIEPFVALLAE